MAFSPIKRGVENSFIFYALLFLACFNFLGRGPVFFLFFSIYGLIITGKTKIPIIGYAYFCLSLFGVISSALFYDIKEIFKSIVYFLSFLVGLRACNSATNKSVLVNRIVLVATLGFVSYLTYAGYLNIIILGHQAGIRTMINPWTGEDAAVTLFGLLSSVPIAYSFYCLFCQKGLIYKVIGFLLIAISLWVNIETATRTPFLLFVIVYIVMFIEFLKESGKHSRFSKIVSISCVLVVILYYVLPSLLTSAIGDRVSEEGLDSSRWELMIFYFSNMSDFPFGGNHVYKMIGKEAHNLVQQSYDMYGFFFFIPLMLILLGIMKKILSLHSIHNMSNNAMLVMSVFVAVVLQVMIEPVISAYPQIVWFLFLIDGICIAVLEDDVNKNQMFVGK